MAEVLTAGQQAILYLNRRGSATYVFCRSCGFTLRCPNCETPLIFHNQESRLICHTCNYRRQMPKTCPECGSSQIRQFGSGTEKVEEELIKQFPGVKTLRWDYETTRQKGAHDIILSHFINHRADVLIGTQMLAKGLDLPLVTLVGVILADVGLNLPDYRSGERTFQLLTQVAGRAGRSPTGRPGYFPDIPTRALCYPGGCPARCGRFLSEGIGIPALNKTCHLFTDCCGWNSGICSNLRQKKLRKKWRTRSAFGLHKEITMARKLLGRHHVFFTAKTAITAGRSSCGVRILWISLRGSRLGTGRYKLIRPTCYRRKF